MYKLSRLLLLLTVVLVAYCAVVATILAIQQIIPPDRQGLAWAILTVGVIAIIVRKKGRRLFSAMGTAAWASTAELARAGMLGARTGLILGRIPAEGAPLGRAVQALLNRRLGAGDACRAFFDSLHPRKRKQGLLVRLPKTVVHTAIFAPTGVGKNVSCITPFLLTCDESCVVVDFKGENALLTAAQRRRRGQKIAIIDPYNVVRQPSKQKRADTFNPLDFIDQHPPLALDECRDLAEALVIRTGEEKGPHWTGATASGVNCTFNPWASSNSAPPAIGV